MAPTKPITKPPTKEVISPKTKVVKAWTYQKYRNGMLNLRAPARFMNITKNNSVSSPFLSLPAEIRNKIFGYVMGGYDIYITACSKATVTSEHKLSDGKLKYTTAYLNYQMFTLILPLDEGYRPALPGDDLPNFAVPGICRQIYSETALLPYTLNHFVFLENNIGVGKTDGKYAQGNSYNTLDLWVSHRSAAQLKAIVSLAPTVSYLRQYFSGKRPSFLNRFPGLKSLDLVGGCLYYGSQTTAQWKVGAQRKDLASHIVVVRRDSTHSAHYGILGGGQMLTSLPTHFKSIVDAVDD